MANFVGDRKASNPEFVAVVCDKNVMNAIENIRKHSPILKQMEVNKEIKITGAVYDMKTGKVLFLK